MKNELTSTFCSVCNTSVLTKNLVRHNTESKNHLRLLQGLKPKKGGRPTKAEQERKRIADLLAEGKAPDGRILEKGRVGRPAKKLLVATQKELDEQYEIFLKGGATRLPKAIKDLIGLRYNHYKNYTFPGSPSGYKGKKYSTAFFDHMQFSNNAIQDMIQKWPRQVQAPKKPEPKPEPVLKQVQKKPVTQPILRLENIPSGYIFPRFEYEKLLKENDKIVYGNNLPSEITVAIHRLKSFLKNAKTPSLLNRLKRTDDEICKLINDWLLGKQKNNSTMDKGNPELEDLSPTEKLKQVEMFADSILETYGELYLLAFTEFCSVKMNKMEILDRNGIIRLSMVIVKGESGDLTVSEFFVEHNEKTKVLFTISPEMKAELREPLIAVLMEKGVAPTPMVRLLITAGRHILMGVFSAAQMNAEIKEALQSFKEFREQEKEAKANPEEKAKANPVANSEAERKSSHWNRKYIAQTTIRDRDTRYTIVQGEECKLQSIDIYKETKMAVLINSQQNKFDVPYDIFTSFFIPSEQ